MVCDDAQRVGEEINLVLEFHRRDAGRVARVNHHVWRSQFGVVVIFSQSSKEAHKGAPTEPDQRQVVGITKVDELVSQDAASDFVEG